MASGPSLGSCREQIFAVGKLIREAQTLDGSGEELGAYTHYLACVQYMVQTLSGDILINQGRGTLPSQQAAQLFKMAKQCLDRAEGIYSTAHAEGRVLCRRQQTTAQPVPAAPGHPLPPQKQRSTPPARAQSWSVGTNLPERQIPPGRQVSQPQPTGHVHRFSFMDEAQLKNRHMMHQYQAYLRQTSTKMLPSKYHDAGLSMLRRLEENVSVARIREQTIARKLRERQHRLQQAEAARSGPRRTLAGTLSHLSVEELCEMVASFEQGKQNLNALKSKLSASPNSTLVSNLVNEILSIADHPLARLLGEGQYSVYTMLKPVGSAIEKAGGLPYVEIKLDEGGVTQIPPKRTNDQNSNGSPKQNPATVAMETNHTHESKPPDDSHLDLLCTEEDDDLFALSTSPRPGLSYPRENTTVDPLDAKLAMLRSSLLCDVSNGGETPANGNDCTENSNGVYSLLGPEVNPSGIKSGYCLLGPASESGTKTSEHGNGTENGPMYANTIGDPTYVNGGTGGEEDLQSKSIYDNDEEIASFFRERAASSKTDRDNVFLPAELRGPDRNSPMAPADDPDGGMFSRPPVRPDEGMFNRPPGSSSPVEEEEEPVVFKNLPPLLCILHSGDEKCLTQIADRADSVMGDVVQLIHSSLQKLEEVFVACYVGLKTEDNREVCQTVLEACFFPAILPTLTLVYRCKNYSEELTVARNMCRHVNYTPKDFSVRKKFWLIDQGHAPYGQAIDEVRKIPSYQCPSPKLECLVRMSKTIIQCIEEYYEAHGEPKNLEIGVDDLLPILSYAIIRSGMPQLVSECAIMEEFIHEGYMKGEEGFCLTSFLTALRFITQMST